MLSYNDSRSAPADTCKTGCKMAAIRKYRWTTGKGEPREAWQVDFRDQEGRRRHKQFRLKKDADAWLNRARAQVDAGTFMAESDSPTVVEAIEAWITRGEAERLERSTIRQRWQHKAHILDVLNGSTRLARISVASLEKARDNLLLRHSRSTARKVIVSLRAILKQAKAVHLATAELAIKGGARHRKRLEVGVDIPRPAEVKALIEKASGKALALVCVALAGLRASEIRGLRWADLDLGTTPSVTISQRADRWSEIGSPKSATSRRTVPLGETAARALRAWKLAQPPITYREDGEKRQRPPTLVFGTGGDRPDGLANLRRRVLEPLAIKAGVAVPALDDAGKPVKDKEGTPVMRPKYGGLHCLRHYTISTWLRTCGGDFKQVQVWAGHGTLVITLDTYGHLIPRKDGHEIMCAVERDLFG